MGDCVPGAPRQLTAVTFKPGGQLCTKLRDFAENVFHPSLPVNSYTIAIQTSQAEALRKLLKDKGFEFVDRPYTIFFAQKAKLSIAAKVTPISTTCLSSMSGML
jgi:hypothetical protein